jgi:hypothetical protein
LRSVEGGEDSAWCLQAADVLCIDADAVLGANYSIYTCFSEDLFNVGAVLRRGTTKKLHV